MPPKTLGCILTMVSYSRAGPAPREYKTMAAEGGRAYRRLARGHFTRSQKEQIRIHQAGAGGGRGGECSDIVCKRERLQQGPRSLPPRPPCGVCLSWHQALARMPLKKKGVSLEKHCPEAHFFAFIQAADGGYPIQRVEPVGTVRWHRPYRRPPCRASCCWGNHRIVRTRLTAQRTRRSLPTCLVEDGELPDLGCHGGGRAEAFHHTL